ncbi:hypothetical protein [Sphingobacterium faecium]|uniref:hypothetical protein n=1 Tax=Sphingobacterium faecium TaxID=34087 RepID=UPI00097EBD0C|nr:hypothetical protein [Sphingobacterium faecium]WGQ15664.1 hypothetical protein QG727_04480 [Sphingobacterium faecium]SJN24842.1 hypothetical protein FM120_04110 [Sphingobacterium faecium PCAi_F2.5]
MRISILFIGAIFAFLTSFSQENNRVPTIFVDKQGVMRWSDTQKEASFYGTNYTAPFAHAYRALSYKGVNHKEAIDRDVYHLARLGYNAYRIHIWDVEISDATGNLLENEHLDLLDYLFFKLQEKGIRILITGMTNFGNGYPEKNEATGAFTYLFDKCQVHADPRAIAAQKTYITQLLRHKNPYTGYAYQEDPYVVGFEINNEPCHIGSVHTTAAYIKEMVTAMKKAGNKKPIFYNVSHNIDHVPAYFNADIQGTTYQWYPVGLVAGKQRQGNFLPYIDQYNIPFSSVKGFANKAKAIYEYDPADNLYGYMHPAMVRTFRSAGFQWITQFAYDPIDIAAYNTEYQTHYLNLAYTPAKAISTLIAAEIAYTIPRNQQFPAYPLDTLFGDFTVSYKQDLSVMNTPEKFYYSNETSSFPKQIDRLQHIAGYRSSPVVGYTGSGAYFLDQLEDGLWRLELMPDAEQVADPFGKPSLSREVTQILHTPHMMDIKLPNLGTAYTVQHITNKTEDNKLQQVQQTSFVATPGVYLLKRKDLISKNIWTADSRWKLGKIGDFYAPAATVNSQPVMLHQPAPTIEKGKAVRLDFRLITAQQPDSIILQTDQVSFWKAHNPYIKLLPKDHYTYEAQLPESMLQGDLLRYTVTVFMNGKQFTYPDDQNGAPLDWDYQVGQYWTSALVESSSPIILTQSEGLDGPFERYAIPEKAYVTAKKVQNNLTEAAQWQYTFESKDAGSRYFWVKDVKDIITARPKGIAQATTVCIQLQWKDHAGPLDIGFVDDQGYTYAKHVFVDNQEKNVLRIPLTDLKMIPTALLPAPYPDFLNRYFHPEIPLPFIKDKIEKLVIATNGEVQQGASVSIGALWLE